MTLPSIVQAVHLSFQLAANPIVGLAPVPLGSPPGDVIYVDPSAPPGGNGYS